jgi:hypothetical protein
MPFSRIWFHLATRAARLLPREEATLNQNCETKNLFLTFRYELYFLLQIKLVMLCIPSHKDAPTHKIS